MREMDGKEEEEKGEGGEQKRKMYKIGRICCCWPFPFPIAFTMYIHILPFLPLLSLVPYHSISPFLPVVFHYF